jgi:hypothetical protein
MSPGRACLVTRRPRQRGLRRGLRFPIDNTHPPDRSTPKSPLPSGASGCGGRQMVKRSDPARPLYRGRDRDVRRRSRRGSSRRLGALRCRRRRPRLRRWRLVRHRGVRRFTRAAVRRLRRISRSLARRARGLGAARARRSLQSGRRSRVRTRWTRSRGWPCPCWSSTPMPRGTEPRIWTRAPSMPSSQLLAIRGSTSRPGNTAGTSFAGRTTGSWVPSRNS